MALKRAAVPFTASAFRFSQPPQTSPASICLRCLSKIWSPPVYDAPRRRSISTTIRRMQTLEPHAPPRNAGIPDTSIAGGRPNVDDQRPLDEQRSDPRPSAAQVPNYSIGEKEAQQPQPTQNTPATGSLATDASSTKPQRKSKLRPRKAAMSLSPSAVTALKQLLEQPDPKLIRVGVKNRGCSGLAYHLEYVDKPGAFDEAVEQEGVKVLIDSKALFSIIGSEMDWIEDKLSRRFVFKNPNITEQCGCGESFSVG